MRWWCSRVDFAKFTYYSRHTYKTYEYGRLIKFLTCSFKHAHSWTISQANTRSDRKRDLYSTPSQAIHASRYSKASSQYSDYVPGFHGFRLFGAHIRRARYTYYYFKSYTNICLLIHTNTDPPMRFVWETIFRFCSLGSNRRVSWK